MNPVLLIIAIITFALVLGLGIGLIFLGFKLFRSGLKKNKNFTFYSNADKMPEEVKNIFNNFPNFFNQTQGSPSASNTQTPPTSEQKNRSPHNQTPPPTGQYTTAYKTSKEPIPANPHDKLPGGNVYVKTALVVLLGLSAFFASLMGASFLFYDFAENIGLSENMTGFIGVFIILIVTVFYSFLFIIVRNKFQKSLPQFYTNGIIAAKKIVQRMVRVRKNHHELRNFCVLTIALPDNTCVDFDTPSSIYNAVLESDSVGVVYNKLSANEFQIVSLNRQTK